MTTDKKKKFRLPWTFRLKKNKSFQAIYRNGTSYVDKYAIINVMPITSLQLKIGFAVGKKLGNAVVRNHTKRLMREVFRHSKDSVKVGYEIIFVARKPLINSNLSVYYAAWNRLVKKAGLYRGDM